GFEFVIGEPIALAGPAERLAADLASADPDEWFVRRKRVGVLEIIDEKLMAIFVAGIAEALHRLILEKPLLIAEAAKLQLIRPDVLGKVAGGNPRRAGFEHDDIEAALGEFFGHPSATGTGTNDDHFVD